MNVKWSCSLLVSLTFCWVCNASAAGQWQPLCIAQESCLNLGTNSFQGGEPFVDTEGIWFHTELQEDRTFKVFRLTALDEPPDVYSDYEVRDVGFINANSSVLTEDGAVVTSYASSWLKRVYPGSEPETEYVYRYVEDAGYGSSFLTAPVRVGNVLLYIWLREFQGKIMAVRSIDDGFNWEEIETDFGLPSKLRSFQREKILSTNPQKNGFWLIQVGKIEDLSSTAQKAYREIVRLVESKDGGETWQRVDDGSFPDNAYRIIHDPEDTQTAYVLTDQGLYVSRNEGVSWSATSLKEKISTLVFVPRNPPLQRVLIVGTETGVLVSQDEGLTWEVMSNGLTQIPHMVVYGHGMLVATSELGYFTCQAVDCAGVAQEIPIPDDQYLVTVTEFYNTNLDHYFITSDEDEVAAIEAGRAGKGWQQTGYNFNAWMPQRNALDPPGTCRFYGSQSPGPNSHFYTISKEECAFLVKRSREVTPDKPRWNLEYQNFFAAFEPEADGTCKLGLLPVYRAYNNGFSKGIDSNHRFVTDRTLLQPLIAEGWVDEGVKLCTPP